MYSVPVDLSKDGVATGTCLIDGYGSPLLSAVKVQVVVSKSGPPSVVAQFRVPTNASHILPGDALLYNSLGTGYLATRDGILGIDLYDFVPRAFFAFRIRRTRLSIAIVAFRRALTRTSGR
jgi:hypothetical protein